MNKNTLQNIIWNWVEQNNFVSYIEKLSKDNKQKYIVDKYTEAQLAEMFNSVKNQGLVFDGIHITLQNTGITYDYVAYKNKMLLVYPESTIDVSLVYAGDEIEFGKESGKVEYKHKIKNPFEQRKDEDIIWAYAVIRNKRWEFLTTLNKDELEKHRKTAKTDFIWKAWFAEMCMKTIMKKACKTHFWDIFTEIEEMDNQNYDVENVNVEIVWKDEIEKCSNMSELLWVYERYKWSWREFDYAISTKKQEILWKSTT